MSTKCPICTLSYDATERKPRVLECGHATCHSCLMQLSNDSKMCAICFKSWPTLNVESLLVCYQLIGLNSPPLKQLEQCTTHQDSISLWCTTCKVAVCCKCVKETHRDCDWDIMDDKVAVLKTELTKQLENIKKMVTNENATHSQFEPLLNSLEQTIGGFNVLYDTVKSHKESHLSFINDFIIESELLSSKMDEQVSFGAVLEQSEAAKSLLSKKAPIIQPLLLSLKRKAEEDLAPFMNKLQIYSDNLDIETINVSDIENEKVANLMKIFKDNCPWIINNPSDAAAVVKILSTTGRRPSSFIISGKDWPGHTLQSFLSKPIFYNYEVIFKSLDSFYHPSEISAATTDKQIGALLNNNPHVKLTTVWGHLNQATLDKLPATVKHLGLVLCSAQDVKALCSLINAVSMSKQTKWFSLSFLDLVISNQLATEDCKLQWPTKGYALTKCGDYPLHWLTCNGTTLCIHLPDVTSDCTKAFNSFYDITINGGDRTEIGSLYLPYATVDEMVLLGRIRDWGLRTTVHLPSSSAPAKEDARLKEFTRAYGKYGCTLKYDAESSIH